MAMRNPETFGRIQGRSAVSSDGGLIHPLAVVEEGAVIGHGTKVWRFAHVRTGAVIGDDCILGNAVFIDTGVRIGNQVKVQNCGLLYAGVSIGDEVFVGPNVTFTNDRYPRASNEHWELIPTQVCHGASIGANSTIVCGVTIGAYAMVAAGSVVTKDVPPFALVRGNPARHVGYVCVCGQKLETSEPELDTPVACGCGCVIDLANAKVLLAKK